MKVSSLPVPFTDAEMDACGRHEYQPETCPVCRSDAEMGGI